MVLSFLIPFLSFVFGMFMGNIHKKLLTSSNHRLESAGLNALEELACLVLKA